MDIKTERLKLSIITRNDIADVFETLNNQHTATTISVFSWPMTMDQATWWCDKSEAGAQTHTEFMFIARQGVETIGCVGAHLYNEKNTEAQVGYWVAKRFQAQGFATEMLSSVLDFAQERYKIHNFYATTAQDNSGSVHVLEKCGFKFHEDIDLELPDGMMRPSKLFKLRL